MTHHHDSEATLGPSRPASVLTDIGGAMGAAVLYVPEGLAGLEIEVRPVGEPWDGTHTGVRERHVGSSVIWAAFFGSLAAGRYEVRVKGGRERSLELEVHGGHVTEADVVASASTGLQLSLVITALGLGFRHGIDWDHIAAISDITGSQEDGRRSMVLATFYALGHAAVVFALGVVAIALSAEVPHWLDDAMGRIVGITLLALGIYVVVSLARQGRDFRMRSRWMLVFAFVHRAARRGRAPENPATDLLVLSHEHAHRHDDLHDHAHEHPPDPVVAHASIGGSAPAIATTTSHRHLHHHVGTLPADPFPTYGRPTAIAVGALHGIGAETPTQILLFLAAARAGGTGVGVALLLCFVLGLLASNTVVALTASFGFLRASRNFAAYATMSVVTATVSLIVGALLLAGHAPLLPALAG